MKSPSEGRRRYNKLWALSPHSERPERDSSRLPEQNRQKSHGRLRPIDRTAMYRRVTSFIVYTFVLYSLVLPLDISRGGTMLPVNTIIVHYLWRSSCGMVRSTRMRIDTKVHAEVNHHVHRGHSRKTPSFSFREQYSLRRDIPSARSLQSPASALGIKREKSGLSKSVAHSALNGATIDALQKLNYDRMQQTHVLGTAYGKTIHAEVTDHFRYVVERLAELSQDVSVQLLVLLNAHVHEAASAPKTKKITVLARM